LLTVKNTTIHCLFVLVHIALSVNKIQLFILIMYHLMLKLALTIDKSCRSIVHSY